MHTAVLRRLLVFLLVTKIIQEMINGFNCWRYEIDRISMRESFPSHLKSLNMVKVYFVDVKELAT